MKKERSEDNCLPHRDIILSQKYIDSFWSKVEITGEDSCWKWKAFKNKQG